jgi:hypothetical protein
MLSPRDVAGKYGVRNCDGACTEWGYKTVGGDNCFHKSNQ